MIYRDWIVLLLLRCWCKGKSVLAAHIPHHFSSKLEFMNNDFQGVSAFRPTKHIEPSLKNDIVNLLHSASPIHYSFAIVAACLLVAISILVCICTFLRCPKFIEILLTCVSNQCWLKQRAKTRIAELNQRNIFAGNVPARSTFREYQQGTNNDVDPVQIPLMPMESPPVSMTRRSSMTQPLIHQRQQHHNEQIMTHHKDQQFDHQPTPQTDMYTTRASSAPPAHPPPYTPELRQNQECKNDVQNCYCASDPRYSRQCMRDMSNVQM